MYNDHLPPGCGPLPGESKAEEAYESWFQDAEARLLEDFTREYLEPMYGLNSIPLSKDWDSHDKRAWDKFVEKAYDEEKRD